MLRDIPVSRIMSTRLVTIAPAQSVIDARQAFDSNALNHLPVVEHGALVGILSTADMLKCFLLDPDSPLLESILVRQVMQCDPVVLSIDANLRDAAEILASASFHALPIVRADRTLAGIVTSSDLVSHLVRQIPRGDGSLRMRRLDPDPAQSADIDVSMIIHGIEEAATNGKELSDREKILLSLHTSNKQLRAVFHAAERYIRSGLAEREHSVLVKCLDELAGESTRLEL